MITIIKPRAGGKTTELIKLSAKTQVPILTMNYPHYLIEKARHMGVSIPAPIIIGEILENIEDKVPLPLTDKVLVDDAEYVLQSMLLHLCNLSVAAITVNMDKPIAGTGGGQE